MRGPAPREPPRARGHQTLRFADRLKLALVIHRRKTVTEAARELNMSRPHFSNVINGHDDLSIKLALRIQKLLNIDARQMLIDQLDEKLREASDAHQRHARRRLA